MSSRTKLQSAFGSVVNVQLVMLMTARAAQTGRKSDLWQEYQLFCIWPEWSIRAVPDSRFRSPCFQEVPASATVSLQESASVKSV